MVVESMPSAPTNRRGLDLNCRFAVNGIQKDSRLFGEGSNWEGANGCAAALAVADIGLVLKASGRGPHHSNVQQIEQVDRNVYNSRPDRPCSWVQVFIILS